MVILRCDPPSFSLLSFSISLFKSYRTRECWELCETWRACLSALFVHLSTLCQKKCILGCCLLSSSILSSSAKTPSSPSATARNSPQSSRGSKKVKPSALPRDPAITPGVQGKLVSLLAAKPRSWWPSSLTLFRKSEATLKLLVRESAF